MGINLRVKEAIESLSTQVIYIRAINLNEANYTLPKTLLDKPVGINANAGDITTEVGELTTYSTVNYPIDVWFLTKNTSQDDTGEQIDVILDAMFELAWEFFQRMNPGVSGTEATEGATYTPVINWSDEMLSGYQITFELNEALTEYVCKTVTVYESDFSSSLDSWFAGSTGDALTFGESIGGEDDAVKMVIDTKTSKHQMNRNTIFDLKDTLYNVSFRAYILSANADLNGVRSRTTQPATGIQEANSPALDVWFDVVGTYLSDDTTPAFTTLDLIASEDGNQTFEGNGTDEIYILDVKVTRDDRP